MDSTNHCVRLNSAYEIVQHWPFLLEAMAALNAFRRANAGYTAETFFDMLVRVASMNQDGLILLLQSKNNKNLGMGCAFTAVDFCGDACFFVWGAYTTGKCPTALKELLENCETYARSIGQKKLKMSTPRNTGSAIRLFETKLGFSREATTFAKQL